MRIKTNIMTSIHILKKFTFYLINLSQNSGKIIVYLKKIFINLDLSKVFYFI